MLVAALHLLNGRMQSIINDLDFLVFLHVSNLINLMRYMFTFKIVPIYLTG